MWNKSPVVYSGIKVSTVIDCDCVLNFTASFCEVLKMKEWLWFVPVYLHVSSPTQPNGFLLKPIFTSSKLNMPKKFKFFLYAFLLSYSQVTPSVSHETYEIYITAIPLKLSHGSGYETLLHLPFPFFFFLFFFSLRFSSTTVRCGPWLPEQSSSIPEGQRSSLPSFLFPIKFMPVSWS